MKPIYVEPESFEDFVPDGWNGKYHNFALEIPQNQRCWIAQNGRNLIREQNQIKTQCQRYFVT